MQCDLLELRDAHAKLRTSNEKMRREKERHEKERQELKDVISNKFKLEQIELRNINILMQQVQDLLQLFPELNTVVENGTSSQYTPTPPRRLKVKDIEMFTSNNNIYNNSCHTFMSFYFFIIVQYNLT